MVLLTRLQSFQIPSFFLCPISLDLMKDPVTLCTGMTYDRSSIERWLDDGNVTCPATNQLLDSTVLTPNHTLRRLIQDWCVLHRSLGVERIPTPKLPVKAEEIKAMLDNLMYGINAHETLSTLRRLAKESEKNRKLVSESGAVQVLVSILVLPEAEGEFSKSEWLEFIEGTLATIVQISSGEGELSSHTATSKQVACICWVLKHGSLEAKLNAAAVLGSIASINDLKGAICHLEGVLDTLVRVVKEKDYPKAVKASLRCLFMLCTIRRNRIKIVEAGGVDALVELIPGAETRGTLERALRILEVLSSCAEGREAISGHALAIPVLLKVVVKSSSSAIEHGVVILYMLSEYSVNASEVRKTIVEAGGFPRLLLLLQTECSRRTKDKAVKLLKQIRPIWKDFPCSASQSGLSRINVSH